MTGARRGAGGGAGWASRVRRLSALVAPVLVTFALLGATRPAAHPLHTTLTEILYRSETRTAEITMRIFADDLGAAAARRRARSEADRPVSAAEAFDYVASTFAVVDQRGRRLPLRWRGARRQGDLLWLSLSVPVAGLAGLELRNGVLCDLYDDQVNIVQVVDGGRRASLLFTRTGGGRKIGG